MMQKKGVAWTFILEFTLGAIILLLILHVFFPNLFPYPGKLLGLVRNATSPKGEFAPYQDQLTKDEVQVDNSINALRCAINSVAVGKKGFSTNGANDEICPGAIPIKEEEEEKSEECQAKYGNACIKCEGSESETIVLGVDKDKIRSNVVFITSQVADTVYNCFKEIKENPNLEYVKGEEFFNCNTLDARQIGDVGVTEKMVIDWLKNNPKYDKGHIKDLTGGWGFDLGLINKDQLTLTTIKRRKNPYCVYYDLDLGSHDVVVGDCRDDVIDTIVCEVKNFTLPQDVGIGTAFAPKFIIGAHGKPRWLVYYESFPQEKTAYWKKSFWGKFFSWNTVGNVVFSAVFNWAFAKFGTQKAAKAIIQKGMQEGGERGAITAGREVAERTTREAIEAGSKVFAKRLTENGMSNTIRSMFIQKAVQEIPGITIDGAQEITQSVMKTVGKKGGSNTFEQVLRKKLVSELDSVIEEGIKKGTIKFEEDVAKKAGIRSMILLENTVHQKAYKEVLLKEIMDEMPMETGTGIVNGLKGVFSSRMTKTVAQAMIKRESLENTLKQITKEIADGNTEILTETGENVLKYLGQVQKVEGEEAIESLLRRAAARVDELTKVYTPTVREVAEFVKESGGVISKNAFRGTFGMPWDEFIKKPFSGSIHILKELQPIKVSNVKWFNPLTLGPPGKVVASIGKTAINLPAWVAKHPYAAFILLTVANELDEEDIRETVPTGSNTLAVTIPYIFGTDAKTYELYSDVSKYFITNKDRQEQRLYLASPCVSDFKIIKKTCSCVSNPLNWRWNFGGGLMDVDRETIRLKPYEERKEEAIKEANSGEYKLYEAWKNAVSLYFELKNKGINVDKLPSTYEVSNKKDTLATNEEWKKFLKEFPEWNKKTETKLPNTEIYYENLYEVILFNEKMRKEGRQISQNEMALEMWIEYIDESATSFFEVQTQPYSNMVDTKIGWFRTTRIDIDKEAQYFTRYSPYVDTSEAIKVCDSRGIIEQATSIVFSKADSYRPQDNPFQYVSYKIDCIQTIPNVKEGYCYDYFKTQEYMKLGLMVYFAAVDITISVTITAATGGVGLAAAPAIFMATGAIYGLYDSIISSTELWPLRG